MKIANLVLIVSILFCAFPVQANNSLPPPPEIHVDPDTILNLSCYKPSYEVYGYTSSPNVAFHWMYPDSSIVDTNAIDIYYSGEYVLMGVDTITGDSSFQRVHVYMNMEISDFSLNMPHNPPLCGDTISVDVWNNDGYIEWFTPYGYVGGDEIVIYEAGNYWANVTNYFSGCQTSQGFEVLQVCEFAKVNGLFYYDYNQDQIKDPIEPLLKYDVAQSVMVTSPGETLLAPYGTYYKFIGYFIPTTFEWVDDPAWMLTTNNAVVTNPGTPNTEIDINYGMYPTSQKHDMEVYIPYLPPRCNTEVTYRNRIYNTGTYEDVGKIIVTYGDLVSYVSTDGVHDVSQKTITWDYSSILPLYRRLVGEMTFLMPDENSIGETIDILTEVYVLVNGAYVLTDSYHFQPEVHCAFDPNAKSVTPAGVGDEHLTLMGRELMYRVQFENEGNASAKDVVIKDQIDTDLDISTLRVLESSHPVQPVLKGSEVRFVFADIDLGPSKKGFVDYVIQPKAGLPELTEISNTAYIYFDQNAPIVTNTTLNTYVSAIPSSDRLESCVPFTVHYTAESVVDYQWSFPGGIPSSSQNSSVWVTYESRGEYETQLAFNGISLPVSIIANDVPSAYYTFTYSNMILTVENQSTEALNYLWDFGDGTFSTEENPVHSYAMAGNYSINLVASNACGFDTLSRNLLFIVDVDDLENSFGFELFPNPNSGAFSIYVNNNQLVDMELAVWDVLGRQVHQQKWNHVQKLNTDINIEHLPKGSYHYSFHVGAKLKSGVFTIE